MTELQAVMIDERIACPEAGYPHSEARFMNIKEWEQYWGLIWEEYLKEL